MGVNTRVLSDVFVKDSLNLFLIGLGEGLLDVSWQSDSIGANDLLVSVQVS